LLIPNPLLPSILFTTLSLLCISSRREDEKEEEEGEGESESEEE
jgi:hypothetical protein